MSCLAEEQKMLICKAVGTAKSIDFENKYILARMAMTDEEL